MTTASTLTDGLIIIGSGPSGYTTAICAARAGLAPRVIAGSVSVETRPWGKRCS
jgi:thioredoxin reductase (NADPH)